VKVDLVGGIADGATREVPDNCTAIRYTQPAGAERAWYEPADLDAPPTARVMVTKYLPTGRQNTTTGNPIFEPEGPPKIVDAKP
jgi:hypothetical protein